MKRKSCSIVDSWERGKKGNMGVKEFTSHIKKGLIASF
jgi:hypothetical protein